VLLQCLVAAVVSKFLAQGPLVDDRPIGGAVFLEDGGSDESSAVSLSCCAEAADSRFENKPAANIYTPDFGATPGEINTALMGWAAYVRACRVGGGIRTLQVPR
jgi:hypothetical protein